MKRVIACISLVAVATTAAVSSSASAHNVAPKTAQRAQRAPKKIARAALRCRVAPADEYFGRLKMSILGIRNTIKDQALKIDYDPGRAPTTLNAIALTEDAIHDWQHKYPCDSWLPGSIYALEHFYTKIHTTDGVHHVHLAYAWLRHDFPRHRLMQPARNDDSRASVAVPAAAAASVEAASVASGTTGAASAASQTSPGGMPMQSQATPVPGLAPQSVINAQNPHPHHP